MKTQTLEETIRRTLDNGPSLPLAKPEFSLLIKDTEFLGYVLESPATSGLYYSFLYNLTKEMGPKTIVELGNRQGVSTASIIAGMDSTQVFYTVDVVEDLRLVPKHALEKENVHVVFGDCLSQNVVEQLPNNIEFLFSDTEHTFAQISAEWKLYEEKLADRAIVAIDDINFPNSGGDKNQFIDKVKHYKHFNEKKFHGNGFFMFEYVRDTQNLTT